MHSSAFAQTASCVKPVPAPTGSPPLDEAAVRAILGAPDRKYARRIAKAKEKEYPRRSPADWTKAGYAASGVVEALRRSIKDMVPRIHADTLTEDEFAERFERANTPVVIDGLCRAWKACSAWTLEGLLQNYGGEKFKVGEDDDGYAVYIKLKYFIRYMLDNQDDSPLYVFDSSFADRPATRALRQDYSLPRFFTDDLFRLVGEKRRPPFRWFVLGPERSGSYIHIDPLGTSAWNALLSGHKCWALFPPSVSKETVQPKNCGGREAIAWFVNALPLLQASENLDHRPITVIQRETMFVPGGWWHVVLNLDTTVAVTQNFCSRANFDSVWLKTRKSRPKMSLKLQESSASRHELSKGNHPSYRGRSPSGHRSDSPSHDWRARRRHCAESTRHQKN
ncbi:hypothetical protein AB1Y20_006278 [Prymnesium parvum]|uniref:JmjC domain-containing protein n=1 Tax=Prymnesium parvum TaxID=97485 RepID=A0AB34J455_PRYPA